MFVVNTRTHIKLRSNDRFDTFISSSSLFTVLANYLIILYSSDASKCPSLICYDVLAHWSITVYGHSSYNSRSLTCGI